MKSNFWIPLAAISALLAGFYFLSDHSEEKDLPYEKEVEQHRTEIEYFMRNAEGSPFAGRLEEYKKLSYYPVDPSFKVIADFTQVQTLSQIELSTSDGKTRSYYIYGYLNFNLQGKPQRLTVYQPSDPGDNELFLGFGDETSAGETYGGGRYLNITHNGGDKIELDFNLAYNPYCAYNEEFVCPFPPRENIMDVPVTAGEKNYKNL